MKQNNKDETGNNNSGIEEMPEIREVEELLLQQTK